MELWKVKHETGQWIEVEAAEAMPTRSGFLRLTVQALYSLGMQRNRKNLGKHHLHQTAMEMMRPQIIVVVSNSDAIVLGNLAAIQIT